MASADIGTVTLSHGSSNAYDIGDLVRVSAVFKNLAGVATDPTTVALKYRAPDGTVTEWEVTAGEIVKDSVGNYHADISPDAAGYLDLQMDRHGSGSGS